MTRSRRSHTVLASGPIPKGQVIVTPAARATDIRRERAPWPHEFAPPAARRGCSALPRAADMMR
jgi:hypothetical protein